MGLFVVVLAAGVVFGAEGQAARRGVIDLSGLWQFSLDKEDVGISQQWFLRSLPEEIRLPGSTDEQGFGVKNPKWEQARLTREFEYVGPAWYVKKVKIPASWAGRHITLFLERAHWETQVWADGEHAGMRDSLSVPHVYDLSALLGPGEHTLAIRVDNRLKVKIYHKTGWVATHAVTDHTQTNWNGIIGRIKLRAAEAVWIEAVKVFEDFANGQVRVEATVGNSSGSSAGGWLSLEMQPDGRSSRTAVLLAEGLTKVEGVVRFGRKVRYWDEFSPQLYRLGARVDVDVGGSVRSDEARLNVGLREFSKDKRHFMLNGRKIFLRGNLECAVWPQTGYPAMEVSQWRRVLEQCRAHGLNHLRFHSWCPPEAAFEAADELGFMYQVELPLWEGYGDIGSDPGRVEWLPKEARRIIDTYGNHPSFCLMSMGNELVPGSPPEDPFLNELVEQLQEYDERLFYTCTTHPAVTASGSDYFVTAYTKTGTIRDELRNERGVLTSSKDYESNIEILEQPVIAHEVGQLCGYPDFGEIEKYNGPLKPRNLRLYRRSLEANGLLEQADEFSRCTGAQQIVVYKHLIENLLRTENAAGFQMLGIQDFPGQGCAEIGILDPFWDSKALIEAEQWRHFCGPTVPLISCRDFIRTAEEIFTADAEVAHFGPKDIKGVTVRWRLEDSRGGAVGEGSFGELDIHTGGNTHLGGIEASLADIKAPDRLKLTIWADGAWFENSWKIWVYPAQVETEFAKDIAVVEKWDEGVKRALSQGRSVVFFPDIDRLKNKVKGRWDLVAWSYGLFANQPQTMGILCEAGHPLFRHFPTEAFADLQWEAILADSAGMVLTATPQEYRPVVQFIHDFNPELNKKLGGIIEARVSRGKLLAVTVGCRQGWQGYPAARQLRGALVEYVGSPEFEPRYRLTFSQLDEIFEEVSRSVSKGPAADAKVMLRVDCAADAGMMKAVSYERELDEVVQQGDGFDYIVKGCECWRDERVSAWAGRGVEIVISCPEGFEGLLYVHFSGWNGQGRDGHIFFNGKDCGMIGEHKEGVWLTYPVTRDDSIYGKVIFSVDCVSGPNLMVTEIAMIGQ